MPARAAHKRPAPLAAIRLLVLDVDGVMTDGRLRYDGSGEICKTFHVRDGYGIRAVLAAGIDVAVISGRESPAVSRRCKELGIRHLHQGIDDKAPVLAQLLAALDIPARQCACVGDDRPDMPLLAQAGLAVAVADAHPARWRSRTGARACPAAPARCARCATGCSPPDAAAGAHDSPHAVRGGGAGSPGHAVLSAAVRQRRHRGAADVESTEPGYIANGAELIETDDDGHPLFRLDAERIEQPTPRGTIFLTAPKLDYQPEDR
jgi:3-deoxy-D-manno-octulosonate 8-phosphate phosphatase (KDO 8-P phosphatase)